MHWPAGGTVLCTGRGTFPLVLCTNSYLSGSMLWVTCARIEEHMILLQRAFRWPVAQIPPHTSRQQAADTCWVITTLFSMMSRTCDVYRVYNWCALCNTPIA